MSRPTAERLITTHALNTGYADFLGRPPLRLGGSRSPISSSAPSAASCTLPAISSKRAIGPLSAAFGRPPLRLGGASEEIGAAEPSSIRAVDALSPIIPFSLLFP